MNKVDIDKRYIPSDEIRTDEPYIDYFNCLRNTFDLNSIESICDFGCANGNLLKHIKINYPHVALKGVEYFSWQKEASDVSVKDIIQVADLRDILTFENKYDILNCTEVGEHIEPEFTSNLIQNIKNASKKYVITTWAKTGGKNDKDHDPLEQHLNPLQYNDYIKLFESNDFVKNEELTQKFINESLRMYKFYFWWRESLVIWNRS